MNDYTKTCWTHNAIVERQKLQNVRFGELLDELCSIQDELKRIADDCLRYERIDFASASSEYKNLNSKQAILRDELEEVREDLRAMTNALKPLGDK